MDGEPLGEATWALSRSREMHALDFAKIESAMAKHGWNLVINSLGGLRTRGSVCCRGETFEYMDKLQAKFHSDRGNIKFCTSL